MWLRGMATKGMEEKGRNPGQICLQAIGPLPCRPHQAAPTTFPPPPLCSRSPALVTLLLLLLLLSPVSSGLGEIIRISHS